MENKLYFTEEQLKHFLDYQTPRDRKIFEEMYKNRDRRFIEIPEVVESCIFNNSDEILDIYVDWKFALKEEENRKKGIIQKDDEFSTPFDHTYTEEEIAEMHKEYTEEELNRIIKDIKWGNSTIDDLKQRGKGMF